MTIHVGSSIVTSLVEHDAWVIPLDYEDGDHYTVAVLPPGADISSSSTRDCSS